MDVYIQGETWNNKFNRLSGAFLDIYFTTFACLSIICI